MMDSLKQNFFREYKNSFKKVFSRFKPLSSYLDRRNKKIFDKLIFAIRSNELRLVQKILRINFEVLKYRTKTNDNVFHLISSTKIAQEIVRHIKDFQDVKKMLLELNEDGLTPLMKAVMLENLEIVNFYLKLLEKDDDALALCYKQLDKFGNNVFHHAVLSNNQIFSALVEKLKHDPYLLITLLESRSSSGFSPLEVMINFEEVEKFRILFQHLKDLSDIEFRLFLGIYQYNVTALLIASTKSKEIVDVIIDTLIERDDVEGLIICLKSSNNISFLEEYLKHHDLDQLKKFINIVLTRIMAKIENEHKLLSLLFDIIKGNFNNFTIMKVIFEEIQKIISEYKKDSDLLQKFIEFKDQDGNTLLLAAAKTPSRDYDKNIMFLYEQGWDLNAIDMHGNSIHDYLMFYRLFKLD